MNQTTLDIVGKQRLTQTDTAVSVKTGSDGVEFIRILRLLDIPMQDVAIDYRNDGESRQVLFHGEESMRRILDLHRQALFESHQRVSNIWWRHRGMPKLWVGLGSEQINADLEVLGLQPGIDYLYLRHDVQKLVYIMSLKGREMIHAMRVKEFH